MKIIPYRPPEELPKGRSLTILEHLIIMKLRFIVFIQNKI